MFELRWWAVQLVQFFLLLQLRRGAIIWCGFGVLQQLLLRAVSTQHGVLIMPKLRCG